MERSEKIGRLKVLGCDRRLSADSFYDFLEEFGDLKTNYHEYAQTAPIDCDQELLRLPSADYDTCCAFLTMLLREDHFSNGSFEERQRKGQVKQVVERMRTLLENEEQTEGASMKKILLDDLLHIPAELADNVKVKFNQHNGYNDPMDLYLREPELINAQWLFWRTKQRYFNVGQIAICLLKLSYDTWLLTTIKRVTKEYGIFDGVNYEGEELEEYRPYYGRVIIKYHKKVQRQGMYYPNVCNDLEVLQLLPTIFDGDEFPGYDNVRLSYAQLESILKRRKQSWIAALENQKAVYVITDTNTGKLYIGSATSDKGMLLQRWSNYVENGHGGNKELIQVIKDHGFEYVKEYFQYAILENYNAKIDDHIVLKREVWWKDTLQTRKFGYNAN